LLSVSVITGIRQDSVGRRAHCAQFPSLLRTPVLPMGVSASHLNFTLGPQVDLKSNIDMLRWAACVRFFTACSGLLLRTNPMQACVGVMISWWMLSWRGCWNSFHLQHHPAPATRLRCRSARKI
jgi:hypothetical protein